MDVKLPKLGEGADSGVVVNIFVKEGDTVAKDQAILELENEKAVASIPSTGAGIVAKVHVKAGDRVGVGARLITITESGQSAAAPVAAAAPKPAAKKVAAQAAPEPEEVVEESAEVEEEISDENVAASPSIRKIARELGINLG
ncbi:MAG TPA: biotin/lipoyl-containing protein, partial [Dongiaceae bacterium]|nr:biotin/lipoyl-containing protein [Dongiaceae bacterium]